MSASLTEFHTRIGPLIREKTGGHVEVDDVKESLNRGIRELKSRYGVYASKNRSSLSVFPTVHEYPAPSDFADFVAPNDRGVPGDFDAVEPDEFWKDLDSRSSMISEDAVLGARFLLVKNDGGTYETVHSLDAYASNGTWTADTSTSDALNVRTEDVNFKSGASCVSFDVDVSQSGNNYSAISVADMTAVDLSDYEDSGTVFLWVYIPTVTYVTSCTLRWGSSSSDYWEATETDQHSGLALMAGWNRLGFAWSGSTETGTPVSTAVDYLYFRLTYSASQTDMSGVLIDRLLVAKPKVFDLDYYSTYFVRSSGGTAQTEFSAESDTSMLADEDDDVLLYWVLEDAHIMREQWKEFDIAEKRFERAAKQMQARRGSSRKRKVKGYYKMARKLR